ncbi:MAG TPA: SAM-dependent methyltransferase [Burkholderiales bacterium]|jgi:16S rRNA (cytidine1402-2'-O)-methyltransferase|nr:SAM-dependent methyltransferase [Burkholderiales bacterium]
MGQLYLIPVDLVPGNTENWIGTQLKTAVQALRFFVVERPKSARQFLKALNLPLPELTLEVLDEHSGTDDVQRIVRKLEAGVDLGLLSEAGCPAIADPGAALVAEAHRIGARVIPLVGPSSIVLALMASGLNGQRFAFNGYLPARSPERERSIRELEERSRRLDQTEIFIEAPYRNDQLFGALLRTCDADSMLSLATDLTGTTEQVTTRSVAQWKNSPASLDRRPTVFLLLAKGKVSANRGKRPDGAH